MKTFTVNYSYKLSELGTLYKEKLELVLPSEKAEELKNQFLEEGIQALKKYCQAILVSLISVSVSQEEEVRSGGVEDMKNLIKEIDELRLVHGKLRDELREESKELEKRKELEERSCICIHDTYKYYCELCMAEEKLLATI